MPDTDIHASDNLAPVIRRPSRYAKFLPRLNVSPRIARLFCLLFFLAYVPAMAILCVLAYAGRDLPSVETFWLPSRPVSVQIVDRNGRDILVRGAQEAQPISLSALSPHVRPAILSIEDRRFYDHAGVDPIGLMRAMRANFKARDVVQGGSTLTQQLAKNVFLTSDKTLMRKVQESLLAVWLERSFSKDEILEKYLSRVSFGGNAWGLEAASQHYFRKSASDLSRGEAALIVGLLKGPTRYNPLASTERAERRTAVVLAAMEHVGHITPDQRREALLEPIAVYPPNIQNGANYFVDWIWPQLEALIGPPKTDIVVRTTLDINAQRLAEAAVVKHIDPERGASQAAVVTMDGNGGIQAMVGGVSFRENQFNRAHKASRQPGSAFKPFVYLTAFNAGMSPWDVRMDAPVTIGDWAPRNFTQKFLGNMTLEDAFARSVNTIAVMITEEVGRERVVETAKTFGLGELEPYRSLPLGAQQTTPLALTAAYMPFANWGDYVPPFGIISVSTANGTPLYDRPPTVRTKVVTSQSLAHMNRVMTRTVDAGSGWRARLPGRMVAGKTGTTNDYKDAWFIGYVPDTVTSVWVGADDHTAMKQVTGGSIPAKIWQSMMSEFLKGKRTAQLPVSSPPVRAQTDKTLDVLLDDVETALP